MFFPFHPQSSTISLWTLFYILLLFLYPYFLRFLIFSFLKSTLISTFHDIYLIFQFHLPLYTLNFSFPPFIIYTRSFISILHNIHSIIPVSPISMFHISQSVCPSLSLFTSGCFSFQNFISYSTNLKSLITMESIFFTRICFSVSLVHHCFSLTLIPLSIMCVHLYPSFHLQFRHLPSPFSHITLQGKHFYRPRGMYCSFSLLLR